MCFDTGDFYWKVHATAKRLGGCGSWESSPKNEAKYCRAMGSKARRALPRTIGLVAQSCESCGVLRAGRWVFGDIGHHACPNARTELKVAQFAKD